MPSLAADVRRRREGNGGVVEEDCRSCLRGEGGVDDGYRTTILGRADGAGWRI